MPGSIDPAVAALGAALVGLVVGYFVPRRYELKYGYDPRPRAPYFKHIHSWAVHTMKDPLYWHCGVCDPDGSGTLRGPRVEGAVE